MENKFKLLEKMLKDRLAKTGKATAEINASKNPMKYISDSKNMSIKKNKGIAL
jgi:hypothetical protein